MTAPPETAPVPSPRRSRATAYTAIGCLLALALGAAAGSWRRFVPAAPAHSARSAPTPAQAPPRAAPLPAAETELDPTFAEEIGTATGAKRWLLLLSAAEHATAADMPAMIRSVGTDAAAVRMLAARWAELDPKHMFSYLYGDSFTPDDTPGALPNRWVLSDILFQEWTKRDLASAIKALNDAPAFPSRENFRMQIANYAIKSDVEQGLQVMKDWGIRNYLPDMKSVTDWAARDPRHAAEVVLKFGGDYAGQEALKLVGRSWGNSDPEGGLRFAATLDPAARATLGTELIREWAKKNVAAAAEFAAAQADLGFRGALAKGLVESWGQTDPAAALAWSEEHLRGTARNEAISGLVKAAAQKSLTTASELVADMQPGPAQNRACASIFETWFKKGAKERTAAFEWLASLPDAEARRLAFERVQWNWMWEDPEGVREFISGPHGDLASSSMIRQVANRQAAKNPEEAMQWAAKFPAERATEARSAVLESWLSIRPEAAGTYVRNLPAGAERERAVRTVTQNLVYQSVEQVGTWYRTLPTADQRIAQEIFKGVRLSEDKQRQLDAAINGP